MSDYSETVQSRVKGRGASVPMLLQRFAARRSAIAEGAEASDAAAGGADDNDKVMSHLLAKYLKLSSIAARLQTLLGITSDPGEYDDIALQLAEVRAEESLCKARYDAIEADQPFSDPGPEAEDALLNAIRAVDTATQNEAGIEALIGAIHGLVQAYAAQSTK